jgi:hypothetical protein
MNPVTLRGTDQFGRKVGFTLMRLWHAAAEAQDWTKDMSLSVWLDDERAPDPEVISVVRLDEDHVVRGLELLFPGSKINTEPNV